MWLNNRIYDVVVVINYNLRPAIKNKGSAIFLHVAKKNYSPTKGCIAVNKKDILFLIRKINKNTKLIINQDLFPKIEEPILRNVASYFKAS